MPTTPPPTVDQLADAVRQFNPPQYTAARDAAERASQTGDLAALLQVLRDLAAENDPRWR